MSRRSRRGMEFNSYIKSAVRSRAGNTCEVCHQETEHPHIHHRVPIWVGKELGIPHVVISSLANAQQVCGEKGGCHEMLHKSRNFHIYKLMAIGLLQLANQPALL